MKGTYIFHGDEVTNKGEFSYFSRNDGTFGIIYCCPDCGGVSAGTNNHKFDRATLSCKPSLVHKCGFHKTLNNGKFV